MHTPWFESVGFGQGGAGEAGAQATPAQGVDPAGEAAQGQAAEVAAAGPAWPGQLLRLGSRGGAVSTLQGLLNAGGAGLSVDGDFGARTRAAVLAAQRAGGISADGVVGAQTWGLLAEGGGGPGAARPAGDPPPAAAPEIPVEGPPGAGSAPEVPLDGPAVADPGPAVADPGPAVADPAVADPAVADPAVADPAVAVPARAPGPKAEVLVPADPAVGAAGASAGGLSGPERQAAAQGLVRSAALVGQDPAGAATASGFIQGAALVAQGGPAEDQGLARVLAAVIQIPEAGEGLGPAQQVAALDFLEVQVSLALPAPPPKISAWLGRVRSMRSFYASMAGLPPAREGDMEAQAPVSSARQAVVGAALSQVGRVVAKGPLTDTDEEGREARQGWRNLRLYFKTATNEVNEALMRRPHADKKLEHGSKKLVDTDDTLPSWCGIFATWANVAGGLLPEGAWGEMPTKLDWDHTRVPKPGDILNMSQDNHFGILTWIETPPVPQPLPWQIQKLKIRTVEGNVTAASQIQERSGTFGDWNWGARNPEEW